MIYIAHRGLINGPDKKNENSPEQILNTLVLGFDCEIDLWKIDDKLWLGHDEPQYEISRAFLNTPGLWIHAKNIAALDYCQRESSFKLNFFWHENDAYTLTSFGYIWVFPGNPLSKNSVLVMPESIDSSLNNVKNTVCFGVCSDYVEKIKQLVLN